ncbi:alpha/beta hydrolase [Stutzerimonas stutzeri]|uniref:Alpha/beta hydrolase n=1 Tax=Stutzerimonas stutzeri TaxID=316 RepID=W8QXY4_STUST|nr:alpha/beta fold hydrolase [Stutzerimonas stutzeri]AHL75134.1 alpha/beta hydrolase [Stutzerimonas stutzeri]MCQ4328320.1 lysophospholipase [Stutzerimonas stutzeri]
MRFLLLFTLLAMLASHTQARTLLNQTITVQVPEGRLHGSLLLPKSHEPLPVALLIAGSGPTDRDGNNPMGRNDSLKRLAQALARRGMASLRYDKRGVGRSLAAAPDERQLSVDRYVADAVAWTRLLKADPRFSKVVLIGHSEGALIASLAEPLVKPAALISIAGSGQPIDLLLREQLQGRLPPPLLATAQYLIDELKAGRTHEQVPEPLQVLFRPSVQPYLITLFGQDPARALANTTAPALLIQGTHDIQVGRDDAYALQRAREDAELVLIPGMNHVLRIIPMERDRQRASYNQPELPIAHALPQQISQFLRKHSLLPSSS